MRLPAPMRHIAAHVATCCCLIGVPWSHDAAVAAPPSDEAQASLRQAFQAERAGFLTKADTLFTASIEEWTRTRQPSDELAALLKSRGSVRKQQGQLEAAEKDLSQAIALLGKSDAAPDPAEVQ